MTVYVEAFVRSKNRRAGMFHVVELLDEEGDDLTHYLEQPSKLFTIGELTEVLKRRFSTEVCIEVIDSRSDISFQAHDSD